MKEWFCSGSRTSSSAEVGPPASPAELSISSIMKTGFWLSARFRLWMIFPGRAPM
jgi:hypothetical protein